MAKPSSKATKENRVKKKPQSKAKPGESGKNPPGRRDKNWTQKSNAGNQKLARKRGKKKGMNKVG